MTALILSFIVLAYVVIPGILVRRLFSLFVPLKKPQWNRTEELTSAVVGSLVPFVAAVFLVKFVHWFGHNPFPFDDSTALRWSDYKTVFSASYSEKIYEDLLHTSSDAFWQSVLRVCKRQSRLLVWYYAASGLQAVLVGLATFFYGDLRRYKTYEFLARKFLIPNMSEWHVMLTPFIHPRKPKRSVRLEILTPDHKLYRGAVGDYHIDKDGHLTGILLKDALRYDLRKYDSDFKKGDTGPSENYWRKIPGHALYILAEKIHNLNVSYPSEIPMDEVAEKSLKDMNIAARVSSEPQRTIKIELPAQEPTGQAPEEAEPPKNFAKCPHCASKGRIFEIKVGSSTPLISRSDGSSFHLFLLFLRRPLSPSKNLTKAFFRYALDRKGITDRPTVVVVENEQGTPWERTLASIEAVADKLAAILKTGESLAGFYQYDSGKLTEMPSKTSSS